MIFHIYVSLLCLNSVCYFLGLYFLILVCFSVATDEIKTYRCIVISCSNSKNITIVELLLSNR